MLIFKEGKAMTTEEIIKRVKECGQSLIDNAESIAGDYRFQTDLDIYVSIPVTGDLPQISVTSNFIPEKSTEGCYHIEYERSDVN